LVENGSDDVVDNGFQNGPTATDGDDSRNGAIVADRNGCRNGADAVGKDGDEDGSSASDNNGGENGLMLVEFRRFRNRLYSRFRDVMALEADEDSDLELIQEAEKEEGE